VTHRSVIRIALLLLSASCTSYGSSMPVSAIPMPADPASRYEVWSGGESWQLHALRIDGDTLRGVRWWHEPTCDSCQVALATSAVDSVRTPSIDGGKSASLALFVIPFVVVWWFFTRFSD
jgi:hypothetical protein